MMKKRVVSLGLAALMILSCLAGCKKEESGTKSAAFGEVWSVPSTVKVQRDAEFADKREAELHFNTVRNEQESQQLFITAKKDIKAYDLKVTDLKNGDAVLSKENIAVYQEKYTLVSESQYFDGAATYMPDALIPMENAYEAGELTVKKGQNAGMWINIQIPKDAKAGVYTGTFTLDVDGTEVEIPVSVTVNDYTLPDTYSAATLFSWRYDRVAAGELDSSIDMMEHYYEYFLANGISLQSLPMSTLSGEEMVKVLDKYYDELTTFCILQEAGEISGNVLLSKEKFMDQILSLAAASTADRNYLSKAFIYTADEPDFTSIGVVNAFVEELTNVSAVLKECAAVIETDTSGEYDAFKKVANWKEFVEDVPMIVPVTVKGLGWIMEHPDDPKAKDVLGVMNCICPVFSCFTKEWTPKIYELCEQYDMKLWWYGCSVPAAPASNYHIGDENLLSARSISWLQRMYDIEGNLYWDAAAYTSEDSNYYNQYLDVFENPYRIVGAPAGDGFLTYPGAAYGLYGPIASMRLMSLRDGMEEYELLKAVEEQYDSLAGTYGEKFDTDACMKYFYHLLSDGEYAMTVDGENGLQFDELRAELIRAAVAIDSGVDFAFSGQTKENNVVEITCFAAEGTEITMNDAALTRAADGSYAYQLDLKEDTSVAITVVSKDGKEFTFNRFIGTPVLLLEALSDEEAVQAAKVSEGSKVQLETTSEYATDGTALHYHVNGVITGDELEDAIFAPFASISTATFEGISKLSELTAIQMNVYNPGETFEVAIRLYSGAAYADAGSYTIVSGKNEVNIGISNLNFTKLDEVDRIAFEFVNSDDGKTPNKYEFYLDNVVGKN